MLPGLPESIAAAVALLLAIIWFFVKRKDDPQTKYEKQLNENAEVIAKANPDDVNTLLDDRINRVRPSSGQGNPR